MSYQTFTINLATAKSRLETLEGKSYTVVPMVMMTEGVHAGSGGPLFYSAKELGKTPEMWNHKPVVVYHPMMNGQPVSACDPVILESRKIGLVMNTKWNSKKKHLTAEAWIDLEKAKLVDNRVPDAIENKTMMELSTGVFIDLEEEDEEVTWNEETYTIKAVNLRPDHLAVLPDQVGACSIKDGAGFFRLNSQALRDFTTLVANSVEIAIKRTGFLTNELSHATTREALYQLVCAQKESCWIEDVYDDFFIYYENGSTYKQAYAVDATDQISLVGSPALVIRSVEWKLVNSKAKSTSKNIKNKGTSMDRTKLIDELIASSLWDESDRGILEKASDEVLTKFSKLQQNAEKKEEKKSEPKDPPTVLSNQRQLTAQEYIDSAPPEIRDVLSNGLATYSTQKQLLIVEIMANERNVFSEDQLKAKSLEELAQIAAFIPPVANQQKAPANYFGAGAAVPTTLGKPVEEDPLGLPVWNFSKG